MFVFLHEMSHVGTPKRFVTEDNHAPMFWRVFKFYLTEAVSQGVYKPIRYDYNNSIKYCGVDIVDNPYFDTNVKEL
jgi:hypothetical protein